MRILILTNTYPSKHNPYGGIFVRNQCLKLREVTKHSLDIYALKARSPGNLRSLLSYIIGFLKFFPHLYKKYDIVHVHFFSPMILYALIYRLVHSNTKFLVTFRGSDANYFLPSPLGQRLFKYTKKYIDHCITVSSQLASKVTPYFPSTSVSVIASGIDENKFFPTDAPKNFDLLFVGSFSRTKGFDLLLEALSLVESDISVCIVGRGSLEQEAHGICMRKGWDFRGQVDQSELQGLYAQARFLVAPSRSEGFPNVTGEALFCGTPCIVSGVGGQLEQITDGVNGFICGHHPAAIAETIDYALQLPAKQYAEMAQNAKASLEQYRLSVVCNKICRLYESLNDPSY